MSAALRLARDPWAQGFAAGWVALTAVAAALADGRLPFDRPAFAALPVAAQLAAPTVGLLQTFGLMGVAWWLTRRRPPVTLAARSPERGTAARETAGLLAYAALAQAGGWWLGAATGGRPFGFHLAGTLFGCRVPPTAHEAWVWAAFNFVAFALLPLLWFRRRYSATQLNLRSTDTAADIRLIVVIAALETMWEFVGVNTTIFILPAATLARALPLTAFLYGIGTVLPTMILIYAILLPRYRLLTGSPVATTILGGLTYAAMHLVEGWSVFDGPRDTALSLIFVVLGYTGPGMIKSVLTLRTGNAWVHAIGYHLIAPHVAIDTPLIARTFAL